MVVPTLMARTASEGENLHKETSTRLLELAAVDQDIFRAVVGGMSGAQRSFLEDVIRSGQQGSGSNDRDTSSSGSGQPTIALKMDFGG